MTAHLLLVDDDDLLRRSLTFNLEKSGYRVSTAANAEDALLRSQRERPDLVILDIGLPGMDGLEALRQFRERFNVPVIFLTARRRELDQVVGLELGADDYVVKPFSPREVVARVRTIYRRATGEPFQPQVIRVGDLQIDLDQHTVMASERQVELTPTEFDILAVLAQQPRRVFTRMQIMEQAQGNAFDGYERTIDAHIKNIRIKLELNPKKPAYIHTVFGVGYKLEVNADA